MIPVALAVSVAAENVNVVGLGTVCTSKLPLNEASDAPLITTVCPTMKPCAVAVVSVTTPPVCVAVPVDPPCAVFGRPLISTVHPAKKPCAADVSMVTTPFSLCAENPNLVEVPPVPDGGVLTVLW